MQADVLPEGKRIVTPQDWQTLEVKKAVKTAEQAKQTNAAPKENNIVTSQNAQTTKVNKKAMTAAENERLYVHLISTLDWYFVNRMRSDISETFYEFPSDIIQYICEIIQYIRELKE